MIYYLQIIHIIHIYLLIFHWKGEGLFRLYLIIQSYRVQLLFIIFNAIHHTILPLTKDPSQVCDIPIEWKWFYGYIPSFLFILFYIISIWMYMSYVMHIQCWIPVKRAKGAEDHRPYRHLSTAPLFRFWTVSFLCESSWNYSRFANFSSLNNGSLHHPPLKNFGIRQ